MLVAVSSSDGKVVNQHFGKATQFLVYEIEGDRIDFKKTRVNDPACGTDEFQGHDELMGHGILPFEARDYIEAAIKTYLNYKRSVDRVDQREGK